MDGRFVKGNIPWNKGIPTAKETKVKAVKKRIENNSYIAWNKGLTKEVNKSVRNISKNMSGKRNPRYKTIPWNKGLTKETDKRIMIVSNKLRGGNNGSWNNGASLNEYGSEFSRGFRNEIRKRDNQICMNCGVHREKLNYSLSVHHINYDKKLNIKENCISLCKRCHSITNFNREYWITLFQNKLTKLYNYYYSNKKEVILNLK